MGCGSWGKEWCVGERGEEWCAREGGGVGEWWHFANDRWAREELGPHVSVLNDVWCR